MPESYLITTLNDILSNQIIEPASEVSNQINLIIEEIQNQNKELINQLNKTGISNAELFEIVKNYQHQKLLISKDYFSQKDDLFFALEVNQYQAELQKFLKKQPIRKKKEQSKDRFYASSKDKRWIRFMKFFKKYLFLISVVPGKIANVFRKLFKKPPRKIKYWKYKIPHRKLVSYQAEIILTQRINEVVELFCQKSVTNLKEVIAKEQEANNLLIENQLGTSKKTLALDHIKIELVTHKRNQQKIIDEFAAGIQKLIKECDSYVTKYSATCGTLEYPGIYLNYQNRNSQKRNAYKRLNNKLQGWGNTTFALLEDWKIDQEIYNLNFFSKKKLDSLNNEHHELNEEVIDLLLNSKIKIIELSKHFQDSLKPNHKNAKQLIQSEVNNLKTTLSVDNFEIANESIIKFNLPERINLFESKINGFLKEIAEKRWLTKLTEYDKQLSASDLASFSPRELINFEYLPQLASSCNSNKTLAVKQIDEIQQSLSNIEHVVSFNLSSIIESLERGECELKDIPGLLEEGLERSQNKVDEIIETIKKFEAETFDVLNEAVSVFINSNQKLTVNENAFNLRMTVMKAKAIKRSEEIGTELWKHTKTYYAHFLVNARRVLTKAERILLPWKKRIGLEGAHGEIATELSDFLQEATTKINSLPIIYQRLYKIMPLTEMSLFTSREEELKILHKALNSWKALKYSPTVIIGEKRGGHTTLINYFIDKWLESKDVLIIDRENSFEKANEFLSHWSEILKEKNLKSTDDIAKVLSQKYKGKVIVMENIQNYYLRIINGFEAMKMLIQLISKTSKDIFWICSSNVYAWRYLNNTINIAGYFGYVVEMQPFSDEELRTVIMKKNNISGYKIIFSPSSRNLSSKKYQRLDKEEKQNYLRNRFFNDLNGFAQGNISLALTFWLLSTTNISEESIEINSFSPPDFSFINKLDAEKVFIIYLLIMHDGLSFEQLNRVYQKPEDKLRLQIIMLQDDGIILERYDEFQVNPLIYRHSINMLKSRNLIY